MPIDPRRNLCSPSHPTGPPGSWNGSHGRLPFARRSPLHRSPEPPLRRDLVSASIGHARLPSRGPKSSASASSVPVESAAPCSGSSRRGRSRFSAAASTSSFAPSRAGIGWC